MPLLRTLLFAPGNHPRRVEKAITLSSDAVIYDLEDAVAVAEKVATRSIVVEALQRKRPCLGYVRVNALNTEWGHGDLHAVVAKGVDGIVVPKVERASDLHIVEWVVSSLERERGLPAGKIDVLPIVETALGFTNLGEIARSGTRVKRLAFGAGDFTFDLGITWTADETELLSYRNGFVAHSRAAGLEAPIDTVWVDLKNSSGFARSAKLAKGLGFQGKMCIYPDQVAVVNDVFRPTDEEVASAQKVVDAFGEAEAKGLASIQVDGRFVDYPIVYLARQTLARADAIASLKRPTP